MTVRAAHDYAVKRRLHLMWLCMLFDQSVVSDCRSREESAGTNKDIRYAHLAISTHLATSKRVPEFEVTGSSYVRLVSIVSREPPVYLQRKRGVYAFTWHRLFFVLQVCAVRRYRQGGSELLSICL